ncbi:DUF4926 domain-containing protein [Sphingomonas sp. R647]|uniref:DUF4926 domain-containing protein n=1 Tax=Sphingomonas sp. R647 TaxID=2875233 RepID=UPI001CD3A868|nr:DUF4926 domain-containing protein [Sphingomonas sp. R647]MCA1198327.1 DUF4926 domain-containing protein [Sphingomonas sp. R647]
MNFSTYDEVIYVGPADLIEKVNPGDMGYIIEDYGSGNYEVEFSDPDGTTRAMAVISSGQLELSKT